MESDRVKFFSHRGRENIGDIGVEGEDGSSVHDVTLKVVGGSCARLSDTISTRERPYSKARVERTFRRG